jgi:hypothetical protein
MPAMILINNIQSDILESLSRFSFLAISQLRGITGKSLGYLREQLAILSHRKFIGSYHLERPGKAENIYYLTEAGKELLLSHAKVFAGDIRVPVGVPLVVRDYQHRKNFIDLHIALHALTQKQGIGIAAFHAYFHKTGNNRTAHNLEAKTKIPLSTEGFFIPDGVMITESSEGKKLYLLELYNGKDTGRVVQQLGKHSMAIREGTPGKTFGLQANPFVLSAFEHASIRDAVIKRLVQHQGFARISHLYFFAALEDVTNDCENAWRTTTGERLEFT